uniref:Uncharacterized protein n=1 Tax=Mola mola TaxID=94237 RepID=A0A3Q4B593_MOLML
MTQSSTGLYTNFEGVLKRFLLPCGLGLTQWETVPARGLQPGRLDFTPQTNNTMLTASLCVGV